MPNDNRYLFIDTPPALAKLCQRLRGHPWLAVDTEFIRERTYFPELCLLQVAASDIVACVDPLALDDLGPLLDLLYDANVLKVLHAARQDLEIFYHMRGRVPARVFDTQVAAPLLGYPEQIGYAALVEKVLGIRLKKGHTRTDWSQRPLSQAQLSYAADDVRHLVSMFPRLRTELKARGRLTWLAGDFARLADTETYEMRPEEAWRRIKGSDRLKGGKRRALRHLAAWRERIAVKENRPRNWILKDTALLDLATLMPETLEDIMRLRVVPETAARRYGSEVLRIITAARQAPADTTDASPQQRVRRLEPDQEALVDALAAVVRARAVGEAINPTAIASRAELARIAAGDSVHDVLAGWRGALIGEELLSFLRGQRALVVEGGRLSLHRTDTLE